MPQHSPRAVIPPTIIIASLLHGVSGYGESTDLTCISHLQAQHSTRATRLHLPISRTNVKALVYDFFLLLVFYFCLHPTRPPSPFILSCFRDLFLTVDPPPTNQICSAAPCRHTRRLRTATRCPSLPPLPPFHLPDTYTYTHQRRCIARPSSMKTYFSPSCNMRTRYSYQLADALGHEPLRQLHSRHAPSDTTCVGGTQHVHQHDGQARSAVL